MTYEEARDLFRKDKTSFGAVRAPMRKLKQIYEEIGTCENCISWNKDYWIAGWFKPTPQCIKHNINRKAEDYCSDFKKKENK